MHSSYRGYSWTDDIERGIQATFRHAASTPTVHIEYMDLYRHPDAAYRASLLRLYRHAFTGHRFDVIISTDDPSLRFLLAYRDTFAPGVPVVFCGINQFQPDLLKGHHDYTGVLETIDVRATLDAALTAQPQTRTVAVIDDPEESFHHNSGDLRRMQSQGSTPVTFQFFTGVPLEDLEGKLRQLPPNSIVLQLAHLHNRQGEMLDPATAAGRLAAQSPYPVYTCWDTFLNTGVVGGKVIGGYSQGTTAATMALRIVNGTPAAAIPILRNSPSRFIFDYRALARFHLLNAPLPAGATVTHRPDARYAVNKRVLLIGILLLAVMQGVIMFLLATVRQRKRAEARLQEANRLLRTLIDASPMAMVSCDDRCNVTQWNPAAELLFGWRADEVIGHPLPIIPQERATEFTEICQRAMTLKVIREMEVQRLRKDGHLIDVRASAAPLYDHTGVACGFIGLYADITEQKRMEEQERLLLVMHERERLRSEFLTCVSHELKTPLTPILAGLEMLKDGRQPVGEKWTLFTHMLYQQARRLQDLIIDLLNLFQLESGELSLKLEAVSLPAVIEDTLRAARPSFHERGLTCQYVGDTEIPPVRADYRRMSQVLDNLLSNALKYTQTGGVTVRTQLEGNMVRLDVTDTGVGLAPDDCEHIFERFVQLDQHTPGAGLGLSIVKSFMEAQGGTIHAESAGPGQGSTFILHLPILTDQDLDIPEALQVPAEG